MTEGERNGSHAVSFCLSRESQVHARQIRKLASIHPGLQNFARGRQKILSLLVLTLPPNKVCFGPKRDVSVMGGLREHIPMFSEISHVMLTLENV